MMARRGTGSSGALMEEHHQPPFMRRSSAPRARPARMASPVLVPAAALHSVLVGLGRYRSRISWLCSNPPAARTTPRVARTTVRFPARMTVAPTTRPRSSASNSVMGELSHNGIFRSSIDQRNRATPALPQASRRERLRKNPGYVAHVIPHHAGDDRAPSRHLCHQYLRLNLSHRDSIEHPHHVMGVAQSSALRAQHAAGNRLRLHRAMAPFGSREERPVIRVVSERLITHPRALVEEVDHLRPLLQVSVEHLLGNGACGDRALQVLTRILEAVLRVRGARIAIAGDPDTPARRGTRSSILLALLNYEHVSDSQLVGTQRCRERAVPGP